jgi:hypothetical protein
MKFLKILSIVVCSFLLSSKPAQADEGMWVPLFLKELNENEMISMGMQLTAEDIYSINQASMKDAVVLYGRGCTGQIVSHEGLMLTNHHCGYGRIQAHSSVDNDLLRNGFWAMSKQEELPNPGLEAVILVYMLDVTEQVFDGIGENRSASAVNSIIERNIKKIVAEATKDNHYTARVVPFFHGNQYILMVNEVFKDVRLVGAPPSAIGKFGGDTDNWMWPRHTGDFAWFRIYAGKDNKPAEYSADNVPYKPKYSFPISIQGVKEGDFTFVFGYPGSTNQYATSHEIKIITQHENPMAIDMRRKRMDVMENYMSQSDLTRIQYSAKHATVGNFWKKMIGENRGVQRLNGIEKKETLEKRFVKWANANEDNKQTYGRLITDFAAIYVELLPARVAFTVFFEGGYSIELVRLALQFNQLYQMSLSVDPNEEQINSEVEKLKSNVTDFFKNYNPTIDREIAALMLPFYYRVDEKYKPDFFQIVDKRFKSDMQAYVNWVFDKSIFVDESKLMSFLNGYNYKKAPKTLEKDPGFDLMLHLLNNYRSIVMVTDDLEQKLEDMYKIYMKGLMEMDADKRFYPDANSTLRVSYGTVATYIPFDAVTYNYFTTTDGILEKTYQDAPDYIIPEDLYSFLKKGDFGDYAAEDGSMRVAFIANNHTTGGNSGSPVFNAHGHLIGINFDRAWQSTMSDLFYDIDMSRNISVDMRYVLLITDKYAGASHLIDELHIIK